MDRIVPSNPGRHAERILAFLSVWLRPGDERFEVYLNGGGICPTLIPALIQHLDMSLSDFMYDDGDEYTNFF